MALTNGRRQPRALIQIRIGEAPIRACTEIYAADMTTFAPRGQLSIPTGRRAPLRLPLTGIAPESAAQPTGVPVAAPTPARRGLLGLLADLRGKPTTVTILRNDPKTSSAARYDALYRHDDGGSADDGGWD